MRRHDAKTWWLGLAPAILTFAINLAAGIVCAIAFIICLLVHKKVMGR